MAKDNITEITRRDVLISEKNKVVKKMVAREIDIATLQRSNPETVVAQEELRNGATRDIKVSEALEQANNALEGYKIRLDSITALLENE